MKQEYILIIIVGLMVLAYILDAVAHPLSLRLATPYQFFTPTTLSHYPFTTTSIILKASAFFMIPLWLLSFFKLDQIVKGAILLALAALMQLYALQDVATNSISLPLEWSLALTLAGAVLLVPAVFYLIIGIFKKLHSNFLADSYEEFTKEPNSLDKEA